MGSTICTAGFPSAAISASCFTARCDSIWYGFFIATLLFSAKENSLSAYQGWERGVATFYDLPGIPWHGFPTPDWRNQAVPPPAEGAPFVIPRSDSKAVTITGVRNHNGGTLWPNVYSSHLPFSLQPSLPRPALGTRRRSRLKSSTSKARAARTMSPSKPPRAASSFPVRSEDGRARSEAR